MPQIEIHHATNADFPELLGLEYIYQTDYVWQMERYQDEGEISIGFREVRLPRAVKVEYPRPHETLALELPQRSVVLTASHNNRLVGFVAINEQRVTNAAWITDLVVATDLRKQGIGTVLVISAHEWAARRRLRWVTIEMQSKNYPAICLVKKLGYVFCGFNDHYYSNQDIALFFGSFVR